jgi:uncharacterized membrane protein
MNSTLTPQEPKKIDALCEAKNSTLSFMVFGVVYTILIIASLSYKSDLVLALYYAGGALVLTQVYLEFYKGTWKPWLSAVCRVIALVAAGLIIQASR